MPDPTKYRILHELGAGGMGTVCKGFLVGQAGFQRPIVIKQLRNREPEHLRLFVEEARRYALLDHENIGRIFDFEMVRGEPCIILEYIDGWTVCEYLDRQRELGRPPDPDLVIFIVSRVCRALQYVFERAAIVHRDISPSNIMMTTEGTVKLIDFGIAIQGDGDGCLAGKPSYMAPEMVVDLRADHRSDIFGLSTVLYEMLTGERLFRGDSIAEILTRVAEARIPSARESHPSLPDGAIEILERGLKRDPSKRFASAGAMGEACEHFLYDKGYGPTNLTLKHHLAFLFPERRGTAVDPEQRFPLVEGTLISVTDKRTVADLRPAGGTVVSPLEATYTRVVSQRPPTEPPRPSGGAAGRPRGPLRRTSVAPPPHLKSGRSQRAKHGSRSRPRA
ncbi:MAG TPA: serine/threonine-protein kinase [Vicinamibacteria bacterium]|nr:serine/threonine-protein kinase [Vicinamibacteria bacterium]